MKNVRITHDDMLAVRLYEVLMRLVETQIEGNKAFELRRVFLEEVPAIIAQADDDKSLYLRAVQAAEAQADAEAEFHESN